MTCRDRTGVGSNARRMASESQSLSAAKDRLAMASRLSRCRWWFAGSATVARCRAVAVRLPCGGLVQPRPIALSVCGSRLGSSFPASQTAWPCYAGSNSRTSRTSCTRPTDDGPARPAPDSPAARGWDPSPSPPPRRLANLVFHVRMGEMQGHASGLGRRR